MICLLTTWSRSNFWGVCFVFPEIVHFLFCLCLPEDWDFFLFFSLLGPSLVFGRLGCNFCFGVLKEE